MIHLMVWPLFPCLYSFSISLFYSGAGSRAIINIVRKHSLTTIVQYSTVKYIPCLLVGPPWGQWAQSKELSFILEGKAKCPLRRIRPKKLWEEFHSWSAPLPSNMSHYYMQKNSFFFNEDDISLSCPRCRVWISTLQLWSLAQGHTIL
jgi:hypothetical protein